MNDNRFVKTWVIEEMARAILHQQLHSKEKDAERWWFFEGAIIYMRDLLECINENERKEMAFMRRETK